MQPLPSSMLLIKESEYEDFSAKESFRPTLRLYLQVFPTKRIKTPTKQFIIIPSTWQNWSQKELNNTGNQEDINFILVPVSLLYDGNKSIIEVKPQNLMRAVKICSGTPPNDLWNWMWYIVVLKDILQTTDKKAASKLLSLLLFVCLLFLTNKNLNRSSGKIIFCSDFIFEETTIGSFHILWQIGKKTQMLECMYLAIALHILFL